MLMMLPILTALTLIQTQARRNPLSILTEYQEKQRLSADLNNNDKSLISFRLTNVSQNFILMPNVDQKLSMEVIVNWITSKSTLMLPAFDLSQKVRLTISEETEVGTIQKQIITKEFLTQTGFKVRLFGGKKYECKVQSTGKTIKLIKIAMTRPQQTIKTFQHERKNHTNEIKMLQQMRIDLQKAQKDLSERSNHSQMQKEYAFDSFLSWTLSIQMISLLAFVGMQIILFESLSLPSSVV